MLVASKPWSRKRRNAVLRICARVRSPFVAAGSSAGVLNSIVLCFWVEHGSEGQPTRRGSCLRSPVHAGRTHLGRPDARTRLTASSVAAHAAEHEQVEEVH